MRILCRLLVLVSCVVSWMTLAGPVSPAGPGTEKVYLLDLRPLKALDLSKPEHAREVWDTMHAVAALQGIVNRNGPRLYLLYCAEFGVETDQFWWDWLRGEDGWLKNKEVIRLKNLDEALDYLGEALKGSVVYDETVSATSNLASTAAGCEDLLPLRYDTNATSLFMRVTQRAMLKPKLWLIATNGTPLFTGKGQIPGSKTASTGSPKCDAYVWGIKRFVESRLCAPGIAAYYLDAFWLQCPRQGPPDLHTLSNHDYFIAKRAFFFDLSPWADETPNDDRGQPMGADKEAFLRVMHALYQRTGNAMIKVGGFTPWPYKYTDFFGGGKHGGVPTEWEFGRLISQFNGYMEADAAGPSGMANASFYHHYPLKQVYPQPNRKPDHEDWQKAGYLTLEGKVVPKLYVGHYVGDYDAPSWLYKAVPGFFNDPARGKVPLGWAFDPSLADRAPQVFAYVYRHATSNDFFIAGDSGAGYLNPKGLITRPDSRLPCGLEAWRKHCQEHYRRWDMSITGFVLDGASGASTPEVFEAYRSFSPDGCGTHFEKGPRVMAGVPTCPEQDLPDSIEDAVRRIAELTSGLKGQPKFLWARSILKKPEWYAAVSKGLRDKHPELPIVVVDPYTFFGLIGVQCAKD